MSQLVHKSHSPVPNSACRISPMRPRRGITLLFVISMVVLFLLMGTTFVVVSNDYLRGAVRRNRPGGANASAVSREQGHRMVDSVFEQLVRGPGLDSNSPLNTHELLGDEYGYGVEMELESAQMHSSGQFIELVVDFDYNTGTPSAADFPRSVLSGRPLLTLFDLTRVAQFPKPGGFNPTPAGLDQIPGHFNGQILTVTTGEFAGLTTRIISSIIEPPPSGSPRQLGTEEHRFLVQPLGAGYLLPAASAPVPELDDETILINGRAFAGSGAGEFDANVPLDEPALANVANLNQRLTETQLRQRKDQLRSRGIANPRNRDVLISTGGYLSLAGGAGSLSPNHASINEPWDAVGRQNVILAGINDEDNDGVLDPGEVIPSFGGVRGPGGVITDFDIFGSGNVVVDNDNDGVLDGLWIDTGMPLISTPDGEFIKPLVSVLVMDMDGRLNLNAHGNLAEFNNPLDYADALPGGGVASDLTLPRGLGFGPAEVSLQPLLADAGADAARDLMRLRYGVGVRPGVRDEMEAKARYHLAGYPDGFVGNASGSGVDLYGRTGLACQGNSGDELNAFAPSLLGFTTAVVPPVDDQLVDSPYEVNLLSPGDANDRLFSAADLERILRPNDPESQLLATRLLDGDTADESLRDPDDPANERVLNGGQSVLGRLLEDGASTLPENQRVMARKMMTTHSFEVPSIPEDINRLLYNALTVPEDQKAALMAHLLSPEVRRGLPMNLNRLFGNGIDENNNGVIDDPRELEDELIAIGDDAVNLDVDNNGRDDSNQGGNAVRPSLRARHNFARRLFVLLILLTENPTRDGDINDPKDFYDFDGNGDPNEEDLEAHRRMLAQWCLNVVDFRDADSIMTGMEFDLNPFDGWGVQSTVTVDGVDYDIWRLDGDLSTPEPLIDPATGVDNYFVAWGVERPELIITETIAFHDVRTQDRDDETAQGGGMAGRTTDTGPSRDNDFDSAFVPNASAFFELTNPQTALTNSTVRPAELYLNRNGVDLARVAGTGGNETPVWRLLVVDTDVANQTIRPDSQRLPATDIRDAVNIETLIQNAIETNASDRIDTIVRYAYFAEPGTGLVSEASNSLNHEFTGPKVYYPSNTGASGKTDLEPGQHAVIGSGFESGGVYTTYLGRHRDDAAQSVVTPMRLDETQQIVLNPGSGETTWQSTDAASAVTRGDVAIALDANRSGTARVFGITDPVNGYEQAAENAQPGTTVVDIPDGDGGQFVVVDDDVDAGGTPVVLDTPIDQTVVESATPTATWASHPLNHRGLIPGHRVVYLQRLADPTRPFDTNRNPYRIVDSSAVDLYVFNGFEDDEAAQTNPSVEDAPARDTLSTYERSEENNPDQHAQRRLWKTGVLGQFNPLQPSGGGVTMSNAVTHLANLQFQHTLGEVNEFYVNHDGSAGGGAPQPFAWLPWNNRPFANRYELVNVPYTSAAWLTRVFDTRGGGGDTYSASNHGSVAELVRDRDRLKRVFHPNAAAFPHLLNFEADSLQSDRLQQIFDFVEVPSRFAGVHEFVNTTGRDREELDDDAAEIDFGYRLSAPFDELSTFRYPGKVNLNTVFAPQVWNALLGTRSQTDNGSGQRDSATAGPYASKVDFPTWRSTIAESPMRPAVAANYRSGGVPGAANTGLLRSSDGERDPGSGAGGETDYLLAFHEPANAFNNTDRNAYFRNGLRQRLGGVATNRSSVFAIWVTVGYFEWNQETGDLRDKGSGGVEYGEEDGTVQRSRGFYLFDRSIPMAYEPGENHNVDRGVLLRSFIE